MPLGAALAFAGIEGAMGLLHGSQGCSTYVRRHLIGHFREPLDLASSSFDEPAAIFGGRANLFAALDNLRKQYKPSLIGVATTCLAETIGDDVPRLLREYRAERTAQELPELVAVSTPSYQGTHTEGFARAVRNVIETLAMGGARMDHVNLLPGIVSPADLRHLRELAESFGLGVTLLSDFSQTLDGPIWSEYHRLPRGGTPLEQIRLAGRAAASIEFTRVLEPAALGSTYLQERFAVPQHVLGLPIGVQACDSLVAVFERLSGRRLSDKHEASRGRLLDSYVDGHKYVAGKRVAVLGEEDLVAATAGFLTEIGMNVVLCVSGGRTGRLGQALGRPLPVACCGQADADPGNSQPATGNPEPATHNPQPLVLADSDYAAAQEAAKDLHVDLIIGNSSAYQLARDVGAPLVRVGLPIHDRLGGGRILTVGYEGTQQLYDRVVNTLLEAAQDESGVGYTHW